MSLLNIIIIIFFVILCYTFYIYMTNNQSDSVYGSVYNEFKNRFNWKNEEYKNEVLELEKKINKNIQNIQNIENIKNIENQTIDDPLLTKEIIDKEIELEIEIEENLRKLYKNYITGIPSTYDNYGNTIKGIEPDPIKAIETLMTIIEKYNDINDYITLAQLYHRGLHKMEPNFGEALKLYNYILSISEEVAIREICISGIKDIENIKVLKYLNIYNKNNELLKINEDKKIPRPDLRNIQRNIQRNIERNIERNNIIDDNLTQEEIDVIVREIENIQRNAERNQGNLQNVEYNVNYDDPQNTHNSGIVSTTKYTLKHLNEINENINEDLIGKLRGYINKMPSSDKTRDAIKSLNQMIQKNEKLMDSSEMQALNTIIKRADTIGSSYEPIFEALADMQEHGNTVCSTGRMTRIVSSLNGIDEEVKVIPTYAIKEEMMTKAAKIRASLEKISQEENKEFDDQLFKDTLIQEFTKDYLDTNILSVQKFHQETEWINYV